MCILSKKHIDDITDAMASIGMTFWGIHYTVLKQYVVVMDGSDTIKADSIEELCAQISEYKTLQKKKKIKHLKEQLEALENE